MMTPRVVFTLLPLLAAAPATAQSIHVAPGFQPCTVLLFPAGPEGGRTPLDEARHQIERNGCAAGDPLVVLGTGFLPEPLAAALCRRGAGVQISDMAGTEGATRQFDCEYPGRPRGQWRLAR
jgi:hypothetical protein